MNFLQCLSLDQVHSTRITNTNLLIYHYLSYSFPVRSHYELVDLVDEHLTDLEEQFCVDFCFSIVF